MGAWVLCLLGAWASRRCLVAALSGLWRQRLVEGSHALKGCVGRVSPVVCVRPVTTQQRAREKSRVPRREGEPLPNCETHTSRFAPAISLPTLSKIERISGRRDKFRFWPSLAHRACSASISHVSHVHELTWERKIRSVPEIGDDLLLIEPLCACGRI